MFFEANPPAPHPPRLRSLSPLPEISLFEKGHLIPRLRIARVQVPFVWWPQAARSSGRVVPEAVLVHARALGVAPPTTPEKKRGKIDCR